MDTSPFGEICKAWSAKIRASWEFKKREFQDDADEAYRFFDGTYEWLYKLRSMRGGFVWSGSEADMPKPSFLATVNKVAELVQLFGPVLYHKNPIRTVNPRQQPDVPQEYFQAQMPPPAQPGDLMGLQQQQMFQQQLQMQWQQMQAGVQQSRALDSARAQMLSAYLNYTPEALDLKAESRFAIDEALIKGLGLLWPGVYYPPGQGGKMVGSFYGSADDLVLDCDARILRDCRWVARRWVKPTWMVEKQFGIAQGKIRGMYESSEAASSIDGNPDAEYWRAKGLTNDLVVYWEIFSKMGVGSRMNHTAGSELGGQKTDSDLDIFGDYVYLVIAETADFPLNLPNEVLAQGDEQAIRSRLQWPTPFWADGEWPFAALAFHWRPNKLWPMSHIKPGIGELKFLNWAYSFVMSKIKTTCRDFVVIQKSASEELKSAVLHGSDLELIEIEKAHGTIAEVVQFLQHPAFNGDIWKVIEAVETNFEKRVGLTELIYGETGAQLRSASEAQVKSNQLNVRPEDMSNRVEDAMSLCSRMEAFAARWHLTGADVQPVLGQAGAMLWDALITPADPSEVLYNLEYRIEAGSTRKPNKSTQQANMQQAIQTLFQPLFQYASETGNVAPLNALIGQWAESNEFDASKFLLSPPPPPPPPPGAGGKQGGQQPPAPRPAAAPQ